MDLLFADGAFSPTASVFGYTKIASVAYVGVWFVDVITVWALFVGVADGFEVKTPSLQVVVVALVSEEFSVTQWAA